MAIDRGPFNLLQDDDGSNLVGTIWNKDKIKTVLLDPIDAMPIGTVGTWTPVDYSGAGLALNVAAARYWRVDKLIVIMGHLSYPANSNPNPAAIRGLPAANGSAAGGFYSAYTDLHTYLLSAGNDYLTPLNPATGAGRTNAELSEHVLIFSGVYLTA